MLKNTKSIMILYLVVLFLATTNVIIQAEPANNNIVLAAGDMWGTYIPPNYDYNWPRLGLITEDLSQVGLWARNSSLFYSTRCTSSSYFGNPGWSWMSGKVVYDFSNMAFAIEYNDNADFAAANAATAGNAENKHFACIKFNHSVPGWDDPSRNYHIPSDGGAVLSEDRTLAYGTSAWPTQLGVDVKMTVYNWTTNWGHLDDFHLVEYEMTNTGMADLNGDGTVDITNNPIKNLVFGYVPGSFHFRLGANSSRSYYVDNNNYRGIGCDQTFDENGSPYNIAFQAIGSQKYDSHSPSISSQWEYWDGYAGFGFLGAKTLNDGIWQEKFLSFKDANGNQIVPTVGEGEQRGWFTTNQTGWNGVNSYYLAQIHSVYMGAFYKDGGVGNDADDLDYSPNPNLFSSGTAGNPSTFVVKDKADWQYPNGARELLESKMMYAKDGGAPLGVNPADTMPEKNRELEPDIITRGWISYYEFDYDPIEGFGPISIDVGETVRVYFIRGAGFRMQGLRKTFTTARAVFDAIGPDGDVTANVPAGPPVPEIKVSVTENINPLIKWQDPATLGDCDGVKIYKCVAWPLYNSLYDLYPTHDTWWKTMDPNNEHSPTPYNPLFTKMEILEDQQGNSWGPYHLAKVVPINEFANYLNPDDDSGEYPYAWEDDTYPPIGQSCWYYVSSYKEGAANAVPAGFQGLEDSDITWMESGKVNYNGRTGLWESTWPWTWQHDYYPDENDSQALKNIGAAIVIKSNNPADAIIKVSANTLDFGDARIGDLVKYPDNLVIWNAGIADLKIDSIAVPPGFTINKYPKDFPIILTPSPSPRDNNKTETSLIVQFKPVEESDFSGNLIVYHSDSDTTVLTVHLSAKLKQTQNTIYESKKWHQFGLAGRSCLLEGNVQNSDTLYVSAMEEGGYFVTYNGGSTWNFQQITRPDSASIYFKRSLNDASFKFAEKLFFDTKNHGCLYYEYVYSSSGSILESTSNKTFKSDDNGKTWIEIFKSHPNIAITGNEQIQILVDPNNSQKVFRCIYNSIAVSYDKGENWVELDPGIHGSTLVIDPSNSNNLYYVGTSAFGTFGIAKSTTAGISWQNLENLPGRCYHLAVSPDNSNILYGLFDFTSSTIMFKSFDGGSTWLEINNGIDPEIEPVSPYFPNAIIINKQNSNQIFFGTGEFIGNVYASNSEGLIWNELSEGWSKYSSHIENISVNNLWLTNRNDAFILYAATNDGIFKFAESAVGVEEPNIQSLANNFNLMQNYPNPFNPMTCINYQVPCSEQVKISIFNMLGQEIITLVNEKKSAGNYMLHWSGRDKNNALVSNGIYICKMTAGNFVQNIKMIVLK